MSFVKTTIFREYDIRGLSDIEFDTEFVEDLGKAIGTLLHEKGETRIAIGRDCRLTSEKYTKALVQGLRTTGAHVILLGICPTPLVYFSIFHEEFDNGISVTGSHNPAEYNGFKISLQKKSLYGKEIKSLQKRIEEKKFFVSKKEKDISFFNVIDAYSDYIKENISLSKKLRVVIDAGNGTAGPMAPSIFRNLGCEVKELFCDMDGRFPNHFPDPTVPENLSHLIAATKEFHADVGIAFDGDADRIGVVDRKGSILWGDELMILYAREILKSSPGATFIAEVKCSRNLFSDIKKRGGRPIMWKTGHSLIKAKLLEEKALLAGEMSGHMFFADRYYGYDDAIYAACRLLEILSKNQQTLDELLVDLPKTYSTPEIRIDCPDEKKFEVVEKMRGHFLPNYDTITIDGVRIEFPDGWALVRASNTQPVLVLRFEASSQEKLNQIQALVENRLKNL